MTEHDNARRRFLAGAAGLALAGTTPRAWAADTYPASGHPIRIIVPYTPAVGADILARLLTPKIGEQWHTNFVVENRPGASSTLGAEMVAHADPDGYTFLFTATSFGTSAATKKHVPYDPLADFAAVSLIATSAVSLCVPNNVPAKTLPEFIDYVRQRPGKLNYASPGVGTPQHLAMELLKLEADINIVHVPYKGSGGATADLVGGHVQAMMVPLQTAAPFVTSGSVKMIAVMTDRRSPAFPSVPTMKELGYPNLVVYTWYAAFAPARAPEVAVKKLSGAIDALLKEADVREALAKQGMTPEGGPPERMAKLLKEDIARWKRVVASAGITED
jgi:tripartite-type tricarboxylate transporter receptor subunit TctC